MIRIIARVRSLAGAVAFWRVDAGQRLPVPEPVPPPPPLPSGVTVADVALAKSEGPIIPSQRLMQELHGWVGTTPPKPWSFRSVERELAHRASLRATRAAASGANGTP